MRTRLTIAALAVALTGAACSGDTSVFDLQVGDCFDDDPAATDEVASVATVDCAEPHDNEIFFEFSLAGGTFPGEDAIMGEAADRCIPAFDAFVGKSYYESDLDIFPITPTAASWEEGDRVVYCVLYALDLSKLTGSMRGANR